MLLARADEWGGLQRMIQLQGKKKCRRVHSRRHFLKATHAPTSPTAQLNREVLHHGARRGGERLLNYLTIVVHQHRPWRNSLALSGGDSSANIGRFPLCFWRGLSALFLTQTIISTLDPLIAMDPPVVHSSYMYSSCFIIGRPRSFYLLFCASDASTLLKYVIVINNGQLQQWKTKANDHTAPKLPLPKSILTFTTTECGHKTEARCIKHTLRLVSEVRAL